MNTTVGIFADRASAERAVGEFHAAGLAADHISMLTPGDAARASRDIPTTESEPPGIGRAIGAVVGGAAGAGGGMQAAALTSIFIPGVGPVIALGVVGAVVLGVAGAAVGQALDTSLREGVPRDEVYVYEDTLRRGRSVVIVVVDDEAHAEAARRILRDAGAESLDAAREQWWLGLRDTEATAYASEGRDFTRDEPDYRRGYEAALTLGRGGRRYDDLVDELRRRYPDVCDRDAFRRGWDRGQATERRRRRAA